LYLIPVVNQTWCEEQQTILTSLEGTTVDIGGDARCDSPGHNAKYGVYHMVELNINKVISLELVQVFVPFVI